MKKLIIILMMFIATFAKAQNYIGYSLYDAKEYLKRSGYIITEGVTQDGRYITYVSGNRIDASITYYFNDNNVCVYYWYAVNGITMDMIESSLAEKRFFVKCDEKTQMDYYENEKNKVVVKWDTEIKNYMIFVFAN